MAKSPRLGLAKRRLGKEIGGVAATSFYRSCLTHTVLRLAHDQRWRTLLAVTPDRDRNQPLWPGAKVARMPQGSGDLGRRMQRLLARLPPGPAVIVGTDIPALTPAHIADAFKLLGGADVVLGPALDGGYWLIGFRRTRRKLAPFAGVRWSSSYALADTLKNLAGQSVVLAAILSDVDTKHDFQIRREQASRLVLPRVGSTNSGLIET